MRGANGERKMDAASAMIWDSIEGCFSRRPKGGANQCKGICEKLNGGAADRLEAKECMVRALKALMYSSE